MPTGSTVAEVADWIGVSSRRVKELRADGVLPGGPGDPYDLRECVRAYCAHMRPSSGKAAGGGSDGAVDLDAARIRLLTAQADAREMLNDTMRAETVLYRDMTGVVGPVLDGVKSKMLGIPSKAAPYLLGIDSLAEMRDKLTEFIHAALSDIADNGVVYRAIADRAVQRAGRGSVAGEHLDEDAAAAPAIGK